MLTFLTKSDKKFWIALLLILLTGFITFRLGTTQDRLIKGDVQHLPLRFNGWRGADLTMSPDAISLIQPDMFLFRNYERDKKVINVFIGYYENLDKSDLAHSPLVCYPGGGWIIHDKKDIVFNVRGCDLEFTQLQVKKGDMRNLVIYGYRAGKLTTGSLIKARINLIKHKVFNNVSNSAFIRFSTDLNNDELLAQNLIRAFLNDFYMQLDKLFESSTENIYDQ